MANKTQGRVAERIRQTLSQLIQFEAYDPRLDGVTVMEVEIDRELMYATVYVSSLEGEEARETVLEGLEDASGFLRRELGSRVRMRHVPELRFKWDETIAYAAHIEGLLDSLDIPTQEPEKDDGESDDAE